MTKTRSITIVGGAFTMAAIALVVLIHLFAPLVFSRQTSDAMLLGMSFGLMGIAAMWVCSATVLTWRRVAACYLVALIMATHFLIYQGFQPDIEEIALITTIWLAHPTIVLVVHVALRWFRQLRVSSTEQREQPPRFGVRHLLVATTAIAVGSLIVRVAASELDADSVPTIVLWVLQSVALTVVAIEARRSEAGLLWQLGVFAASSLACLYLLSTTDDWNEFGDASIYQALMLGLALVVPRLDRYSLQITLETREMEARGEPETAEELTE